MTDNLTVYEEQVLETMLSYMEKHPDFARRQVTKLSYLGDEKYKRMWQELLESLNSLGIKETIKHWQDYWTTLRLDNKQKMSNYLENESRTGNLPNDIVLTDWDIRISKMFGRYGTGLAVIPEAGIQSVTSQDPIALFDSVVKKVKNGGGGKKANQQENITEEQKVAMINYMIENPLFGLQQIQDATVRLQLEYAFANVMNAIPGPKKDIRQWLNAWDNLLRNCDNSTSDDPHNFVNLVCNFKKIRKQNTNMRAAALKTLLEKVKEIKAVKDSSAAKVKMEVKSEPDDDIYVIEDDFPAANVSKASTSTYVGRHQKQDLQSQSNLLTYSDKPTAQGKTPQAVGVSKNPVINGDRVAADVLKSLIQSEINDIIESPQFMVKLKCSLLKDIQNEIESNIKNIVREEVQMFVVQYGSNNEKLCENEEESEISTEDYVSNNEQLVEDEEESAISNEGAVAQLSFEDIEKYFPDARSNTKVKVLSNITNQLPLQSDSSSYTYTYTEDDLVEDETRNQRRTRPYSYFDYENQSSMNHPKLKARYSK